MDKAYDEAAAHYGFHCNGCTDNCCLTRFYHHTHIERRYLLHGFRSLPKKQQVGIKEKAIGACRAHEEADSRHQTPRVMCPLNHEGLCILYKFRPMICRLHGIPNELKHPIKGILKSPGCENGTAYFERTSYFTFDRTPIYREFAMLENQFKAALEITGKTKNTIAQMLR